MITEKAYREAAEKLSTEVAVVKAVAEVESGGNGFLSSGEPKILFEPHVFWKELRRVGIDPKIHIKGNEDILYPVWKTKPYGPTSHQHSRLERATKIHRDAALKSASWGRFQIMGYNYKLAGYPTLQDFINAMYKSEDDHLNAFLNYIRNTFLDDELREKDWKGLALGYNGKYYYINNYDKKLAAAYKKFKLG
jgi:hypothetical protein